MKNRVGQQEEIREDIIEGRNAVIEALKSNKTIEKVMVAKGDLEGSIKIIISLAKEKGIVINEVDRKKLDSISQTRAHQGVIAFTTPYQYCAVEDIIRYAKQKKRIPL